MPSLSLNVCVVPAYPTVPAFRARVAIGTLNLDDIVDSDFQSFPDLVAQSFS